MVKQRPFSSLNEEGKKRMREAVSKFGKHVCAKENLSGHGIMKLRDARGLPRTLYTHQTYSKLVFSHFAY